VRLLVHSGRLEAARPGDELLWFDSEGVSGQGVVATDEPSNKFRAGHLALIQLDRDAEFCGSGAVLVPLCA
jgi:hypothetical protein